MSEVRHAPRLRVGLLKQDCVMALVSHPMVSHLTHLLQNLAADRNADR
jgi:hypothetical protein